MYKRANMGTDNMEAVTSPMAHTASSAARSAVTGAGVGTIAGALLSKGKLHAAGVGGITGGTLGALSGINRSSQDRHQALQAMGLEQPKMASLSPYDAYMAIKKANALGDAIVNVAKGIDQGVLHNVGHVAAATTRGAGHLAEGVANLDLQGALRNGGKFLQDFGENKMNRVVWGRTLGGIAGAGLAYGAGKEALVPNRDRQVYYQGQV